MNSLMDFQLHILPGRCPVNYEFTYFHNEVYQFWKSFWNEVFKQNGSSSNADPNSFYRQNFVAVITKGKDVAGTVFFSENNIQSKVVREITYFDRPYIREFCNDWIERGKYNVSTSEMLTVNPLYRKKEIGISLGSILMGISSQAFIESGNQVMIAPTRLDIGVDKIIEDFGWKMISEIYSMHETPVALYALFRENIRNSEDPEVQKWVDTLWSKRKDLRDLNSFQVFESNSAA